MFNACKVERRIGERTLSIETGKIGRQAEGAVVVQYGDTVVLVAAATAPPRFADIDFFPLSVDYREKQSAAGKFPGGFIKREGRPSTKETLTARTIDRPIRPLFPDGYFQEVQIMANVLSADQENDPDVLAMIGASAALTIGKIPFLGPIGACRLGRVNGEFVVNPTHQQLEDSDISLLLGGRKEAINMIEIGAKELPEDVVADAIATAHKAVGEVCDMIEELRSKVGVEKEIPLVDSDEDLDAKINAEFAGKLYELKQKPDKQERKTAVRELFDEIYAQYCPEDADAAVKYDKPLVKRILEKMHGKVIKKLLLEGKRADGRGYDDIRQIECEVGLLPRTHGSALFTRGETQSLMSVTLGTVRDGQIIDGLLDEYTQRFTLHYNFPPFSAGPANRTRCSRREGAGAGKTGGGGFRLYY